VPRSAPARDGLPWHSDTGPATKAPSWSEFYRVVPKQGAEWVALRTAHPGVAMCVAGDFNVNLGGKHYYGTTRARATLRAALADAALVCVTETECVPAGMLRHPPIDHIALSAELAAKARVVGAWEGEDAAGDHLSDHSGLVVDVNG
jgi:endonuclease/exonuclease/phosphatase family metal-dependent hydrolase